MTPDQQLHPSKRPVPDTFGCPDRGEVGCMVVCVNSPRQGPTSLVLSADDAASNATSSAYVTNHDLEANLPVIPPGS